MQIRTATAADIPILQALREALWPDCTLDDLSPLDDAGHCTILAIGPEDAPIAFAEVTRRSDYVNGCDSSPVAFLEGIYVAPEHRRSGIARALVAACRDWGLAHGCAELASDALLDNLASHAFHKAIGFEETERVVYFRLAGKAAA